MSLIKLLLWFELEGIITEKAELQTMVDAVPAAITRAMDNEWDRQFNIIIASDDLVRQLNYDYRDKDYLTDVLSFPLGEEDEVSGEVYISWSKVLEQAEEYGHSWQREFSFLLVHGILHLLGYDHGDQPSPDMRALEEKILALLGR